MIALLAGIAKLYDYNSNNYDTLHDIILYYQHVLCDINSGCVTSAEAVLIEQQSYHKMLEWLTDKDNKIVVVALSPQSLASLADLLNMTLADTFLKIAFLLKVS